jgi:hypothetical protein
MLSRTSRGHHRLGLRCSDVFPVWWDPSLITRGYYANTPTHELQSEQFRHWREHENGNVAQVRSPLIAPAKSRLAVIPWSVRRPTKTNWATGRFQIRPPGVAPCWNRRPVPEFWNPCRGRPGTPGRQRPQHCLPPALRPFSSSCCGRR